MTSIDLLEIRRGTVTAPAGCGKTHLIAEAITKGKADKPILVLTHTNAGVAALRGRLEKASVPTKAYRLSTIDGWAMRLVSTFPKRSGCDPQLLKLEHPRTDYPNIRVAAARMLKAGHGLDVLAATYSRLFVDEYQDCNVPQHAIVYYMAPAFPTCVLGDPMQAIFDFQEKLADWDGHVCKHFPLVGELSTPWRWKNVDEEEFGLWLLEVRKQLLAGKSIDLASAHANASWIQTGGKDEHKRRLAACGTRAPNANGTVLIIGDSKNPQGQRQFASQTPGATAVESVDLRDLVSFARSLDLKSKKALQQVVGFAEDVMTNVGGPGLLKRVEIRMFKQSHAKRIGLFHVTTPSVEAWSRIKALRKLYRKVLAENTSEARGLRLMRDWLSPDQREQFDDSGYFEVVGCDSGKRYRIYYGIVPPNVYEIDYAGRLKMGLCFMPLGCLPAGDDILAQKVALETDEHSALKVANRFSPNRELLRSRSL